MTATPVSKEQKDQARIVIQDLGFTEASKRLNIKRDTLYHWNYRYKWNIKDHSQETVQTVKPIADLHQEALADYKRRSVTALAKYSAEAAEEASSSKSKLNISRKAKDVADIHKTIWPVEQNQQNILNLAVLVNPPSRDGTETNEDAPELLADAQVVSGEQLEDQAGLIQAKANPSTADYQSTVQA